jgi:hypothetical protein
MPNKALQLTPYSLRSFLASAFGRGSPPALGANSTEGESMGKVAA